MIQQYNIKVIPRERPRRFIYIVNHIGMRIAHDIHPQRAGEFPLSASDIKYLSARKNILLRKTVESIDLCSNKFLHFLSLIFILTNSNIFSALFSHVYRFESSFACFAIRSAKPESTRRRLIQDASSSGLSGFTKKTSFSLTISRIEGKSEAIIGFPLAIYSKSFIGDVS